MTAPHEGGPRESAAEATRRVAEASRRATAELHKQGTPDYDPRQHEKAVERERRAIEDASGS
ncbi:translation initiation factor 2 [Cellulomonas triticagri]|uniref:Translation initiation factor 2 n=1 Tax=Cellulomonas triticagri TaxID=2483352 RepID=A0A3M2IXY7_9CELL|nr:translation initiation factor 2 [Cellulomonas triticagri]RMI04671.1 translation initiation factor 2 [Cellulomonas triticagri]